MVNISNYRTISSIIGYELMNELLMNVGRNNDKYEKKHKELR